MLANTCKWNKIRKFFLKYVYLRVFFLSWSTKISSNLTQILRNTHLKWRKLLREEDNRFHRQSRLVFIAKFKNKDGSVNNDRTLLEAGNYMFKVNNKNTRTRPEICWKPTIKAPCSSAFIVNFRQANAGWVLEVIYQNVQRKVKKSEHSKVNSSEKNWSRECIEFHCRHKYHPKNYSLMLQNCLKLLFYTQLNHSFPMYLFSTHWKHQETVKYI